MAKSAKQTELEQQIGELTLDLQRTRADFENFRKRAEAERQSAYAHGQSATVVKLLPIIDNIERALTHMPDHLKDDKWAQGVASLVKNVEKSLQNMNITRIEATPNTAFDPALHEAIQIDEDAEGDKEVIAEELQAGYLHNGHSIRPSMVKVTRTNG